MKIIFKGVGSVWNYILFPTFRSSMPTYAFILVMKTDEMYFFSNLFDEVLYILRCVIPVVC